MTAMAQPGPHQMLHSRSQQAWRVDAGLRFLSMVNPAYAEAKWAARQAHRRAVASLVASGKLSSGSYNIIQKEPTGETRYITMFGSGAGRNWDSAFPPEVGALDTIEIDLTHAAAGSAVAGAVADAARSISPTAEKTVATKIANLSRPLGAPPLAALSILHWGADEAGFQSGNMSALAIWLVEFFQQVLIIYRDDREARTRAAVAIERYRHDLLTQYRNHSQPGLKVVYLLLLIEIWRAVLPDWPFGEVNWVCGAIDCSHPLCAAHRNNVLAATRSLPGFLGSGLAMRDVYSYTLKNTATVGGVLGAILATPHGPHWLSSAGTAMLRAAEGLRDMLPQAASAERFYSIQHEIMAFAPAAEVAFDHLSANRIHPADPELNRFKHAADEIKARAGNAVQLDFENAINLQPLLECRAELLELRKASPADAEAVLQKWLHDETMFPVLWEPFLSGLTDELPCADKALGQRMLRSVRRAKEVISRLVPNGSSRSRGS
jgi:hypothetical protein